MMHCFETDIDAKQELLPKSRARCQSPIIAVIAIEQSHVASWALHSFAEEGGIIEHDHDLVFSNQHII